MKTKREKRNIIFSNEHFLRLLNKFEKISCRVISDYKDDKYFELYRDFVFNNKGCESPLKNILNELFKNYKSNYYKTKSCLTDVLMNYYVNEFFVSYTFEDEYGKRSYFPNFIVFRIYVKIGNYRKKRLVKWRVPINK